MSIILGSIVWFMVLMIYHSSSSYGEEFPNIINGPKSETVLSGNNVTFSCLAGHQSTQQQQEQDNETAPLPSSSSLMMINWQRNGQSISLSRHWQTLIHMPGNGSLSMLYLNQVSELDEGVYQCTARNEFGLDVSRPARLSVQYHAKITGGQRLVYNITFGTKVPIECNARGQPPPLIELFVGDNRTTILDRKHYSNVFIEYNATETVNITCVASNFLSSINETSEDTRIYEIFVQNVEEPTAQLESIESLEEEQERKRNQMPNGYCAPYIGRVCRSHVPKNSLVFYNLTDSEDFANNINEIILENLWRELITSLQEPCRSAAEKLICYYSFPSCLWSKGVPEGKPLCREDCLAVRESFCNREWALLEDNRQRGVYFKSRGHFRLPNCDQLPSHNNKSHPEQCSQADLTTLQRNEITVDCVRGRGRFYQGFFNVTKHGIPCQRWDVQQPHGHNRPPFVFQEIWNSENYCRNAGGEEPMPWCYTQDPFVRWQHCDIPLCLEPNITEYGINQTKPSFESAPNGRLLNYLVDLVRKPLSNLIPPQNPLSLPLGMAFFLILFLIVSVSMIFTFRFVYYRYFIDDYSIGSAFTLIDPILDDFDLSKLPTNQMYHSTIVTSNAKLEALEYPRNKIIYIRDIGGGAFSSVFMGQAPALVKGQELTTVAVKVLRDHATINMQSDFEREATLMSEFDHPNVLKLLGVCAVGKPMCLLLEYMGRGDLSTFLRSLGPANYVVRHPYQEGFVDLPKKMDKSELVNLAIQVASGMMYLSSKNFVHRDLATRNCLISDDLVVKISDFGLSQRIVSVNYYRADIDNDALPIRWMPLEAILYGKFSTASDVWAFGVLLWEIFSYALQPYYGLTHEQVIGYLKEGNTLTMPDNCSVEVYALMKTCWQADPKSRPSFEALEQSLKDLQQNLIKIDENSSKKSGLDKDPT